MMLYAQSMGGLPQCGNPDCSDEPSPFGPVSFPMATAGGGTFAFRSAGCFGASVRGRLELVGSDGKTVDEKVRDLDAAERERGAITSCLKSTATPKVVCIAEAEAHTREADQCAQLRDDDGFKCSCNR